MNERHLRRLLNRIVILSTPLPFAMAASVAERFVALLEEGTP
jgi:hypothetical protein